jgi:hypothetical protein
MMGKDPALTAALVIVAALTCLGLLIASAMIFVPIIAVSTGGWLIYKYATRPPPKTPLAALYESALSQLRTVPDEETFVDALLTDFLTAHAADAPTRSIFDKLMDVATDLYELEGLATLSPPPGLPTPIQEARYRDEALSKLERANSIQQFSTAIQDSFSNLAGKLPPAAKVKDISEFASKRPALFTIPLSDVLADKSTIAEFVCSFYRADLIRLKLFQGIRDQLDQNLHEISGEPFTPATRNMSSLLMPDKFKGTFPEAVKAYLRDTPFERVFDAEIPFSFLDQQRYEHMHVIGGSGHGKTQLLQHLILHDLKRDEPPALIIIDSQGDMLRKIERLDAFTRPPLADRLVIIDPEDVEFPPALNMFDMTNARLSGYSLAHREQIEAGVIELYNYIFGALAAELTQKQGTAFAYVARLMLSMPGSTIHTLRELMEDNAPELARSRFAPHIANLHPTSQAFFHNQFFSKSFAQTKQQIARRLYGVLQVPTFDRMFSSKINKLDMFDAIQSGKVVLINTSKAMLKSDASALFGRYMIALTIRAAFERVAVKNRNPAFLIVDEAAEYFDETLETLLSQARKFNVGVLFAHQHLDQLSPALRSSVAANTSIKLAGGVSDRDARALAPDMRTTSDFIASMQKHTRSTEFACSVRNVTSNAVRLQIPFGSLEGAPTMSEDARKHLIARNRERYAINRDVSRSADTHVAVSMPDDIVRRSTSSPTPKAAPPPTTEVGTPSRLQDDWRS